MSARIVCPWPGPKPYSAEDAERFFGREREIEKLLQIILHQRFSLLVADSGVGKTSLLQAGLLPKLRTKRDGGEATVGHVILVRRWGELDEQDAATLTVRGIRRAIELRHEETRALPETSRLRRDADAALVVEVPDLSALQDVYDREDAAITYVYWLTQSVDNLILIVDQAEELLGSGLGRRDTLREHWVLSLFSNIYRRIEGCHLMLSMRSEYLTRLKPLGEKIGGLDPRTHHIEPLPRSKVHEAIHRAAEAVGVVLPMSGDQSIIETVTGWLGKPISLAEGDAAGSFRPTTANREPVDLLRLQALLVEIFEHACESQQGDEEVVFSPELLADYRRQLEIEASARGEDVEVAQLGKHALEHYIERIFTRHAAASGPNTPPGLFRYLVVRMARWLSSPEGFKRHIRDRELIYNALREDLEALVTTVDANKIRKVLANSEALGDLDFSDAAEDDYSSGFALGWQPREIARCLVSAAHEALTLLGDEEVLKVSKSESGHIYELVHDGFGLALYDWAEQRRRQTSDTLAALVSRRGENFAWSPPRVENTVIQDVRWLGCNMKNLDLESVIFRNCDLRGSIFLNCRMTNCRFESCNLDGTVFKDGNWDDMCWATCRAKSTLLVKMVWSGQIGISNCFLENANLDAIRLDGSVRLEDCNLRFGSILEFIPLADGLDVMVDRCDLTHAVFEDRERARIRSSKTDQIEDEYTDAAYGPRLTAIPAVPTA